MTYSTAERGTTQLVLGNGMQGYDELLSMVRTVDQPGPWRIITDNCELTWPAGLLLRIDGDVTSPTGPFALALDGSAEKLITFHGPYLGDRIPTRDQLLPRPSARARRASSTAPSGRSPGTARAPSTRARPGSSATTRCRSTPPPPT